MEGRLALAQEHPAEDGGGESLGLVESVEGDGVEVLVGLEGELVLDGVEGGGDAGDGEP